MLRHLIRAFVSVALALAWSAARADSFPSKTITIVVPYGAGGAIDEQSRLIAHAIGPILNTAVIVENRPGAGGQVGTEYAAHQPPDGYTLVSVSNSLPLMPVTNPSMTLDVVKGLTHIIVFSRGPFICAIPPAVGTTLKDFIDYAHKNASPVKYGSSGLGDRMTGLLLQQKAGIKMVNVPFSSPGEQVRSLMRNDVQMVCLPAISILPAAKSGMIKMVAVSTGQRSAIVPDLPTLAESGYPGIDMGYWNGFSAPGGVPADIVATLNKAVLQALHEPDVIKGINAVGAEVIGSSPQQMAERVANDKAAYSDMARQIVGSDGK